MLGGLILNLMPCVFPVLSLKALSLTQQAHGELREQRLHALSYTLGVLATFSLITGVLLALRAGGAAIGWGFQLQNPWVIGALAYLMFMLGLSLSGVIELGTRWMGMGQSLTQSKGHSGSFFTGVLAVVVASPCTAPFMGTALGYAVTQPAYIAFSVFFALGIGFAAPFLLLAISPSLARWLPKPGAWMDAFKQAMAYPLYLTTLWLLWVLGRQTGVDGMTAALAGLLALAAACWLWGRQRRHALLAMGLVGVAIACLGWATGMQSQAATTAGNWQPWSEQRLQSLRAAGKPVLVNMTADWCITCLANERVALDTDAVKQTMQTHQISYLKGDWTRQDPAITAYLAQFRRNGVPLYVVYPADPLAPPQVLPQILTPGLVVAALQAAANGG
jgi:thiol:disulfide interchange protein DsbD